MKIYLVILFQIIFFKLIFSQSYLIESRPANFSSINSSAPSIINLFQEKHLSQDDRFVSLSTFGINEYDKEYTPRVLNDHIVSHNIHMQYDSLSSKDNLNNKSFFKSNLFYFLGTAVAVLATYFILRGGDKPSNTAVTFGLPPSPR